MSNETIASVEKRITKAKQKRNQTHEPDFLRIELFLVIFSLVFGVFHDCIIPENNLSRKKHSHALKNSHFFDPKQPA